jgi:MarR family transcriptional regulator, organic hydroperoxide resistance regulator
MPSRPRLFLLVARAHHLLFKRADAVFKDALGVSTTQLGVLLVLEKRPGAMLKEIGEILGVNGSAITALVGRMEDAALVRRQPSEADGRAVHLFATAAGVAKAVAAKPLLARLNARLTRGFSEREIATVAQFLTAVVERFDAPEPGGA